MKRTRSHSGPSKPTKQLGINKESQNLIALGGGILLLLTLVFIAYIPAYQAEYIKFDDTNYIVDNELLRTPAGLRHIWTDIGAYRFAVQYYPMTQTSFWAEYQMWGAQPTGYHVTNVVLHAFNAVFVWLILRRLRLPGAFLAALIFALHPVHVHSVAWIVERKNVLSGFFFLLTILSWLRFTRTHSWFFYAMALLLFLLGMFSKTAVCTLPIVLLLWIWWKRPEAWKRYTAAAVPFFAIAVTLGIVTLLRETSYDTSVTERDSGLDPLEKILVAGRALWFYAGKLVYPANLVPIYPKWTISTQAGWKYIFPIAAAAVPVFFWLFRRWLGKGPLVAVLYFAISLGPVLGFIHFGFLAHSYVSDHLQYLASIGLLAGLAAAGTRLARRIVFRVPNRTASGSDRPAPNRTASGSDRPNGMANDFPSPALPLGVLLGSLRLAAAMILVLGLGVLSFYQSQDYQNPKAFWGSVVSGNPSHTALSALGDVYLREGDLEQAAKLLLQSVGLRDNVRTRFRLGELYIKQKQYTQALEQFQRALQRDQTISPEPGMAPKLLFNIANTYWYLRDYEQAANYYQQTLAADPSSAQAAEWLAKAQRRMQTIKAKP